AERLLLAKERFIQDQRAYRDRLLGRVQELEDELRRLEADIVQTVRQLQPLRRNRVEFGDLRRTQPISPVWGLDRGMPLDRYYIHSFLDRHRADVRGRVLEIKDPNYTRMFGDGKVTVSHVLDVDDENQQATIVADLTGADTIPTDAYDCFIL